MMLHILQILLVIINIDGVIRPSASEIYMEISYITLLSSHIGNESAENVSGSLWHTNLSIRFLLSHITTLHVNDLLKLAY